MIVAPLLFLVPLGPMKNLILNMWDLDIYCKDVIICSPVTPIIKNIDP